MPESKTDAAGFGGALSTSKSLQVVELAGVLIVGAATVLIGVAMFGSGIVASIGSVWAANVLMLLVVYGGLRFRGQTWAHLGLEFGLPSSKVILITVFKSVPVFVLSITAFVVGAIVMAILFGRPESADMSKYDYLKGNLAMTVAALGSVYLVSSFAEEVIYRGFLITRVSELIENSKWAPRLAVVISSLIFGLVHSDWGLAGMVQASCMGLALGVSYLFFQRNLWVTILAHAYMDTILVLQMYFST